MSRILGCLLCLGLLATGCGSDVVLPDQLSGSRVAAMAERELEAENPGMTSGTLSCPDLDLEVGDSVRCLRTTELSEGRVVKVRGTVTVTSLSTGGRLHVAMDDHAEEFGVAGDHLEADVRQQYLRRFQVEPTRLECPYLRGAVGSRVTCRLEAAGQLRDVDVVVTAVDPATYVTTYATGPARRTRS